MTDRALYMQIADRHGLVGEDQETYEKLVQESTEVIADDRPLADVSVDIYSEIDPLFNQAPENVRVAFLDYLKMNDERMEKE